MFDRRSGGLDLGYAVTSYAVQGSTRGASTSAITATTARSELYVDITRGRASNQLYATRIATGDDEAHLPRLDADVLTELRGRLASGLARTALAIDPHALAVARLRKGRDLAGLIAARRRGESGPIDAAIQRATTAIRQLACTHPPDGMAAALPPRPVAPHLAARWDTAAGDLAVHRALTPPTRRRPAGDGLHRVLGPRPADNEADAWDALAERLSALAVDIAWWHLEHCGAPDIQQVAGWRPAWLACHLTDLARAGVLAHADYDQLGRLVVEVHRWRHTHNLIGRACVGVLGEPPTDPAERWRYEQLARRLTTRHTHAGRGVA